VRVRGVRRPAAGGGVSPWDLGQEVALATIPPGDLGPGCSLVITEGYYYGGKMKIAGEVTKLEMEGGEVNVKLKVTGTDHEGLLKTSSAHPQQQFLCHLCGAGCNKMDVGEFRVHAVRGRRRKAADEEGWVTNLVAGAAPEEEDENQELRQRAALLAGQGGEPGDPPGAEKEKRASPQDKEEESGEVKKKKKKKKNRKKEKEVEDGKRPTVAVQKDLKAVFGGTGLDPRERVRRRVASKAQKFASRKRQKSDSGSSNGSSSSSSTEEEDYKGQLAVFAEETKIRGVAERFPGALTVEAMGAMKRSLLTTSGEELEEGSLRPVALLYFRSVLSRRASGPQAREMLNISMALDHLIRGRVATAADILSQRLKSQESACHGTHWSISQRLEIPPVETEGLVARGELQNARKDEYDEAKTRWQAQVSSGGKADGRGKSKSQKGDRETWKRDDKKEEQKGKGKSKDKK
jgi:hypothetical protein